MTRCRICNRSLTDPTSVRVGIGPECLERAIAEQPELARLRSEFCGPARRVRAIEDDHTMNLFEMEGEE